MKLKGQMPPSTSLMSRDLAHTVVLRRKQMRYGRSRCRVVRQAATRASMRHRHRRECFIPKA
jgi:DNA repair ATPase RecN